MRSARRRDERPKRGLHGGVRGGEGAGDMPMAERRGVASEAAEDSAPYESCRTQPVVDAEARQAENGCLSKRERRNEVRSVRDRASSPDATAQRRTVDTAAFF